MDRKKWTPKSEITQTVLDAREKRKWQIALRRYVLERNKSLFYAPYFGLDIDKFRHWISLQFADGLGWDDFSTAWQFDHIVPLAYFDFQNDTDLRLCWNFTNIRVEKLEQDKVRRSGIDVLAAKTYFNTLFRNTGYRVCGDMVEKIADIEKAEIAATAPLQDFLLSNGDYLTATADFSADEFALLNAGKSFKSVAFEKDFLKKLGG